METFRIPHDDAMLDDLSRRLASTRFTEPTPGAPWSAGTAPAYLRELVGYWRDGFDWPAARERLNSYPQVRGIIGGTTTHAVHRRAHGGADAPAVVLLHG